MKTVLLLGAGFSIPAGYPSGQKLNERFFSSVENKLLRFSSSEWAWDDHGDAASHNGRLNFDFLKFSYLLSELVEKYQKETYETFDYESFYDWFLTKWNNIPFMQDCCETANSRLKEQIGHQSPHFFEKATANEYSEINKCYNHLISDLLNRPYDREARLNEYDRFIKLIQENDEVDIFTLNHDLLVEYLLNKNGVLYSDGFSNKTSCVVGAENLKLPVFANNYSEKIRLFKLHGSVDYFLFRKMNQSGNYLTDTGEYWFFKPNSFDNKHHAKRIDLSTGEIIQDYNFEITPQFLTGKSKSSVIESHLIYKPLFGHFEEALYKAQKVFVIGYSYRDHHVNKILKEALGSSDFELFNLNPNIKFPFRKDYKRDFVKELSYLQEL